MMKVSIAVLSVLLVTGPAKAQVLEAGEWRVITRPLSGDMAAPPQVKMRCMTPDDVADPGKAFSPQVSTVNSECERTEYSLDASMLKWRLQCKGQLEMDVSGQFIFESPTRYTAVVVTKASMMGRPMQSSTASIEGERVGACP